MLTAYLIGLTLFSWAKPTAAFEFLLTRNQRAQKLVEEGQRHILLGEYLRAIDSCNQALGLRSDWSPAYLCRSEAKMMAMDLEAAGRDAKKAGKLDPASGEPLRILGRLEFEAGRYPEAVDSFTRALKLTKLKPENVSNVYYYRAASYLKLERYDKALSDVQEGLGVLRGVNGDYSDWNFYALRAEIHREMNNEAAADVDEHKVISLITERMKSQPTELLELLRRRAESYMLLHDYEAAAKDMDRLLSYDGNDSRSLMTQADIYSQAGRHKEAIADLDRVLLSDASQLPALRLRAMERFIMGDTTGSLSDLDSALAIKHDDAASLTARGILKRYMADYRGSLKDLSSAQALNPTDSTLWGHKAFVLEMLEQHEAALDLAQRTLKQDPDNTSAHIALALAATALERCAVAMPSLNRLIKQSPDSSHYYWLRAECNCKADAYPGCIDDMRSAQSLDSSSAFLALRMAQVQRRYLDHFPTKVTLKDIRDCKVYYDIVGKLKPLDLSSRFDRLRTMLDLSQDLVGPRLANERANLIQQVMHECSEILRKYPNNETAHSLMARARKLKSK
jgi:tetratricopeptide (TPR) repeat protein